jgi:hypothetical protein
MIKKVIIVSFAFFAMSLMALYTARTEEVSNPLSEMENQETPMVVLELFTSQGCSSCPPADILLDKVKREFPDEVFALSYHVDYWDYIGWKDPFAQPGHSRKQREYNKKLGYDGNYTPEMVLNGSLHFVGSNQAKLYAEINSHLKEKVQNGIQLRDVVAGESAVSFEYAATGDLDHKLLRAILVIDERTTEVKRGENRNRTLKNSNIVVQEAYLDLEASAGKASMKIPQLVSESDSLTLVLLVETENLDITAATKAPIKR